MDCILYLFVVLSDLNGFVPGMFFKTPKIWFGIALFDLFRVYAKSRVLGHSWSTWTAINWKNISNIMVSEKKS